MTQQPGVRSQESAVSRALKPGLLSTEHWTPAALIGALVTIALNSDDRVIVIAMAVIAAAVAVAYMANRTQLKCRAIDTVEDDFDVIEAEPIDTPNQPDQENES
jgi:hypothetical protein